MAGRIIFTLMIFLCALTSASGAADIEALKEPLKTASSKTEEALIYKKTGDYYSSQGGFKNAADPYIKALALDRQRFSIDERMKMAVFISWGGRLDKAEEEFRLILSEEPGNTGARISLARVLSWSGRPDPALGEIEKVLGVSPDNKDALLVKANILRWKGKNKEAIEIYARLLDAGEDFDARIGLAYAELALGRKKEAGASGSLLKPAGPYQEQELQGFKDVFEKTARPEVEGRTSHYSDSDFNRVKRYSLSGGFWVEDWKADIRYTETVANDSVRDLRVDAVSLEAKSKLREAMTAGGGLGLSKAAGGAAFLTGYVKTEFKIDPASASFAISREFLTDTALLIEKGIRATNLSLSLSMPLKDKLHLYGGLSYRRYSDDNSAVELQIAPVYTLISKDPRLSAGYRLRYLDYERQSRGGYFDPDNFLSHQVFASLSYELGRFYARVEPYAGYQSHKRYGLAESRTFTGGSAAAGFTPVKGLSIEASVEGGNYALGATTGFRYYSAGVKAVYMPL